MILQDAHVLVIAPHADDETIGLGGFIAKALKEFHCKINVAILTESEPNRNVEMEDALRILEAPSHQGNHLRPHFLWLWASAVCAEYRPRDGCLNQEPTVRLVIALDDLVEELGPDVVLLPCSNYHQDHQTAFNAMMAALRPRPETLTIRLIGLYETASDPWGPTFWARQGKLYCDITEYIDVKAKALAAYRSPKRPIDSDAIVAMSEQRGRECGVRNAEVIYVVRGTI